MKYRYIGPDKLLTPCHHLGNPQTLSECHDGQCKGRVDGMCPFSAGRLNGWQDQYFEEDVNDG